MSAGLRSVVHSVFWRMGPPSGNATIAAIATNLEMDTVTLPRSVGLGRHLATDERRGRRLRRPSGRLLGDKHIRDTGHARGQREVVDDRAPIRLRVEYGNADRLAPHEHHRPVFAGVFGLVHSAGFADYLRGLFVDHIALPLFSFNVGIELGQIVVLAATAVSFLGIDWAFAAMSRLGAARAKPLQIRLVGVSAIIAVVATTWMWERWPR
jgi:hypothetical protein